MEKVVSSLFVPTALASVVAIFPLHCVPTVTFVCYYRNTGMGNGIHGLQIQIAMQGTFC